MLSPTLQTFHAGFVSPSVFYSLAAVLTVFSCFCVVCVILYYYFCNCRDTTSLKHLYLFVMSASQLFLRQPRPSSHTTSHRHLTGTFLNQLLVLAVLVCMSSVLLHSDNGADAFLTTCGSTPANQVRILLLNRDSNLSTQNSGWDATVKAKLNARLPSGSTLVSMYIPTSGIPSLSTALTYDVIVSWANGGRSSDATGWGNLLAQYIDAGGRVILGNYGIQNDIWGGTLESGGYLASYPSSMSTTSYSTSGTLSASSDFSHPVLDGFTTSTTFRADVIGTFTASQISDATTIGLFPNGSPAVFTKGSITFLNMWLVYIGSSDGLASLASNAILHACGGGGASTDTCPSDPNKTSPGVCGCGYDDATDTDGDGICGDLVDNCPDVSNAGQQDADSDGVGNACDNCPSNSNSDQEDVDSDGVGDACDGCPNDNTKTAGGQCGCGNPDTDTDSDGTADCNDGCPNDDQKAVPGVCGCGYADATDTDGDGICGAVTDNCSDVSNADQADADGDGVGDACDNCPNDANADQADDDSDGIGNVCSCPLEDESCNYQPDPPVVTFSDVVTGDDDLAYYRIQMNSSAHWSEYVKVLFPESDNDHCDYPSGQVTWSVTHATNNPCTKQYSVDIPMSDFLGKCGFSQTIRNGDSMLFQQTAQILTNRTCDDGRINQLSLSDVELSEARAITRETQYEIEVVAPTNTTAKTGGLEVFGTAFKLYLLGDLTITPDIDTNMPTITGFFVTETQHPYELQGPVFALTGDFNYATFELTGTYCTVDNSTRLPCQQTWSYSFQPNQTCPDKAHLEGELVQITWNVNCSDGFIGECAPSFAVQPEATFTLNSPIYCFSSDYIELTPAMEVYQFNQLTANSADFGASTLDTLTDNGFSIERVFTIDSQLYAEYTVVAAGTGVTLTATTLKKVSTTTSSRGELVLYETNAAEQIITQATTLFVHDTGFGTDDSSDFADYRTRFQFTWLNDTTVLLDSTEDLAQTIALSATAISIFTNVQSLREAGIDERHPVLSKLNSDQHSKEQEDKHMILFVDGDEPRDSKTTVLARLAPASTTNTPAASTASSGFVVSPTVAAAGIALIAVVASVAFAVIRRNRTAPKDPQPSLPPSSSGVQLTDSTMPVMITTSTIPQMNTLQSIAGHYSTNANTNAYAMQ
jgi:Thrombospondin type 3 repeat